MPHSIEESKALDDIKRMRRLRRLGHLDRPIDDKRLVDSTQANNDVIKLNRGIFIYFAILVIVHIGGGFVNNQGMLETHIVLPYTLAFFPLFKLGSAIARFPNSNEYYYLLEFQNSYSEIKVYSIMLTILLSICIIGETIFIQRLQITNNRATELIFVAIEFLVIVGALLLFYLKKIFASKGIDL